MPTRTGGSSANQSLQSDYKRQNGLLYGNSIASQVEGGIDRSQRRGGEGASGYAKTLSNSDLAKAYEATGREYIRQSGGADAFDKENPEAGNFGSADSYVRMGADSYHDTYYKPMRDELERRWLNTDGKPFWLESDEAKKNRDFPVQREPWEQLKFLMNYEVAPSVSIMGRQNYSKGSGKEVDFSGVSDEIIARSVKLAEQGLSEIRNQSIAKDNQIKGAKFYTPNDANYFESEYPSAWKENILDPLVNELNNRKNK